MEYNKLFLCIEEAEKGIQEVANEKGVVYGKIEYDFDGDSLRVPYTGDEENDKSREYLLMCMLLNQRKTWHLEAFELIDGQDTYRYAYLVS